MGSKTSVAPAAGRVEPPGSVAPALMLIAKHTATSVWRMAGLSGKDLGQSDYRHSGVWTGISTKSDSRRQSSWEDWQSSEWRQPEQWAARAAVDRVNSIE